jgi:hypothetical protein
MQISEQKPELLEPWRDAVILCIYEASDFAFTCLFMDQYSIMIRIFRLKNAKHAANKTKLGQNQLVARRDVPLPVRKITLT